MANLRPKMPDLRIFVLEFENTIVIFGICILGFVLLQNLVQKLNSLSLRLKVPDLGILGLKFQNILVIFEISTLEFA